MPNVDLREIDIAVLRCLRRLGGSPVTAEELTPLLQEEFPESDEVSMREGIALTRLRGRTLVDVDDRGRIRLTAEGESAAEDL